MAMKYVCKSCGKEYNPKGRDWKCECGSYLVCEFPVNFKRENIKKDRYSMWRYDDALPLKLEEVTATLQEGFTPLVGIKWEGVAVKVKMDSLNPSGSFKDRGVALSVNNAKNLGIKRVTEDSSGNAGSSTAMYSALAGIECDLYAPASTSLGKLVQAKCYGTRIHTVEGNREAVAEAAQQAANGDGSIYVGHNWHPLFIQGTKTLAYEIWEQSGFKVPKIVVSAMGGGSTIMGCYYGFKELMASGEIDHMPKLYGMQAANCDPFYRRMHGLSMEFTAKPTIAEGIALSKHPKIDECVECVRESGGDILINTEEEIIAALKEAGKAGLYIEPTSATAFAGAKKLIEQGVQGTDDMVIIVTGNGLKSSDKIQSVL